jgi:hypothetical protein
MALLDLESLCIKLIHNGQSLAFQELMIQGFEGFFPLNDTNRAPLGKWERMRSVH